MVLQRRSFRRRPRSARNRAAALGRRPLAAVAALGRPALVAALAALLCAGATADGTDHDRAVEQARHGQYQPALQTLERLHNEHPDDRRILDDWIVVLGWAGHDEQALDLVSRVKPETLPYYVIEGAAGSARRLHRLSTAHDLLREGVRRFPDQMEARRLLAFTLVDMGRNDEADEVLRATPPSAERTLAQAALADYRSQPAEALRLYGDVLASNPHDARALAGEIRAAAKLGAAHLAYQLAREHPGVIPEDEMQGLLAQRTALDIKWSIARMQLDPKADRFGDLDDAIRQSDAVAARFAASPGEVSEVERQVLFDRVVALTERYRAAEALQLFRALAATPGVTVPAYARAAAGQALLYERQPEEAAAQFEAAIAGGDTEFRTQMGLFYALEESGQDARAIAQIDRLAAQQAKRLDGEDDRRVRENPDYVGARVAGAQARSWANDQDEAERRLRPLANQLPLNADARSGLAGVMLARGWPRQAADEYAALIANDPDNAAARAERAEALLEFDSFRAAEAETQAALAGRPEDKQVQRAARLWRIHNEAELDTDATMGRGNGNAPTGTRDYQVESYLYSPPVDYNWRPFIHAFWAEGQYPTGTARIERAAGGIEYRNNGLTVATEASGGCCGTGRVGAATGAKWWLNDYWHVEGSAELQSNQVPLQARLAGYTADRLALGGGYRFSESRALAVDTSLLHISDGNDREAVYATWSERLFASSRLKLDFLAGIYASTNSRRDAPYFNPRSDFSPTGTLSLEWLTWHRYDRSFSQKLTGTLGVYDQAGFGSIQTSAILYEHLWDLDNVVSLRYGVGRVLHPYDGRQTARDYLTLSLMARF